MTRPVYTWIAIAAIVTTSCAGDVLLSRAMKQVGDVVDLGRRTNIFVVIGRTLRNRWFVGGVLCMTLAFYSLLFALSWEDVSLVGPAAAALTFVANAIAAKVFLRERVDHRRWIAALLVGSGVVLLAR